MRSGDVLTADDAVLFFEQCLREEGLKDVDVAHATEHDTLAEKFYVRKQIGTEQLAYQFTFDPERFDTDNSTNTVDLAKKRLAKRAEEVAREFKDHMVDVFEWDGRAVEVSTLNGGWAQCRLCNTRVRFQRQPSHVFSEDAELSTPHPRPRETERAVNELSGREEVLFKLYLVGQLRERCDQTCPNYKYNYDKPPAMMEAFASD